MQQTGKRPTNEEVRSWMQKRQADKSPPPSPDEIRRQLGWELVEAALEMTNRSKR